ncbi:hypothetical protein ID144_26305 [Pseudomonas sp. JM0905a]|uniref:Uncharacterized protein n=1 Tax=Metapseudomonas resinovorans TaxID=53412 RepID=A0ABT4YDR4_METRE|nr:MULTISPECIES: hypothetical protein [Pseudomonas]MBD2840562.1 hypothetical protein [Pseudomonas sp. JM0905a]MDA8486782.1 hypothetical protein [Pseudomonas resinovorans]MDH4561271.1 hypothetical protein [Pseudomonas sp. BN411]MDH4871966.1 hypothetical protein [Pseudomonas sp. BN515]
MEQTPQQQVPPSEIALLANILALTTRNMTAITTLLAKVTANMANSTDSTLQAASVGLLDQVTGLGHDLELQWDLIQSLDRYCPLLARTPPARTSLVTEIDISQLPLSH